MEPPGSEADRIAVNESLLRERNEAIEPMNRAIQWVDPPFADWHCECADPACSEPVQLAIAEYESIRTDPRRFLVAPDDRHVHGDVERIVEKHDRYWIVQKVGDAAKMAEALDPRSVESTDS